MNAFHARLPLVRHCEPNRRIAFSRNKKGGGERRAIRERGKLGDLEEHGHIWMWMWPELVDWPRPVMWLFSFNTGPTKADRQSCRTWLGPGDSWGIDADGDLLIVEVKKAKSPMSAEPATDPYADFLVGTQADAAVPYHLDAAASTIVGYGSTTGCTALRKLWTERMAAEREYYRCYADNYRAGSLPADHERAVLARDTAFVGVWPYSDRRRTAFQWSHLYLDAMQRMLSNDAKYPTWVECALKRRSQQHSPPPHYVGLITLAPHGSTMLKGWSSPLRDQLAAAYSSERVHLRGIQGQILEDGRCEVSAAMLTP